MLLRRARVNIARGVTYLDNKSRVVNLFLICKTWSSGDVTRSSDSFRLSSVLASAYVRLEHTSASKATWNRFCRSTLQHAAV
jgi:hypothetical protein